MYENLKICTRKPLRSCISPYYKSKILGRLLTAELEGTTTHPVMPYDSEDLQNYITAWIESCLLYKKDHTLKDAFEMSQRKDFEKVARTFFPFTDEDPSEDYIADNENGKNWFIKLYSCVRIADEDPEEDDFEDIGDIEVRLMTYEEALYMHGIDDERTAEVVKIAASILEDLNDMITNRILERRLSSTDQKICFLKYRRRLHNIRDDLDDFLYLQNSLQILDMAQWTRVCDKLSRFLKAPEVKKVFDYDPQ